METIDKINLIRSEMIKSGVDVYIIPTNDPHQSEYLPPYYETRAWASGFTGSAGTLVVTESGAGLWTDGRYYIQASHELQGSGISLFKMGIPGVPSVEQWISDTFKRSITVGFNGYQMTAKDVRKISVAFKGYEITFDDSVLIVDKLWLNRPYLPVEKVHLLDTRFAGETTALKLKKCREKISNEQGQSHFISKLDDIAWLLNLRGADIPNNPYFLSYLWIKETEAILYVDPLKLNETIVDYLHDHGVKIVHYDDVLLDLEENLNHGPVILDPMSISYRIYDLISSRVEVKEMPNPTLKMKAIKNDVEIENMKTCYMADGVSMVKFLHWLDQNLGQIEIDEVSAAEKLKLFRQENPLMMSSSFDSISAYRDHGALMHYRAEKGKAYKLEPKGLFLIDSGGQYLNGTTDITRTVALGDLTEQERNDYTLVLKSMLALSRASFLEGATGTHLDMIARAPMWQYHMDYKSGTGHGIGFYLGVHEGPHRVSMHLSDVALEPGMFITNEPGVYREGEYGIRIENTLFVKEKEVNAFGRFYHFEDITLCPYDSRAISTDLLTYEEIRQINTYHQSVYEKLSPHLSEEVAQWLKAMTMPIEISKK